MPVQNVIKCSPGITPTEITVIEICFMQKCDPIFLKLDLSWLFIYP